MANPGWNKKRMSKRARVEPFETVTLPVGFLTDARLSDAAKVLYALMDSRANEDRVLFFSETRLAATLRWSERKVRRKIEELNVAGYLRIQRDRKRQPDGSLRTTNVYTCGGLSREALVKEDNDIANPGTRDYAEKLPSLVSGARAFRQSLRERAAANRAARADERLRLRHTAARFVGLCAANEILEGRDPSSFTSWIWPPKDFSFLSPKTVEESAFQLPRIGIN